MKKIVLLIITLCISAIASSQTFVTGRIEGLKDQGISMLYINAIAVKQIIDSVPVINDTFKFRIENTDTDLYQVSSSSQLFGFSFWSDSPKITIDGSINHIKITKENRHFTRFMTSLSIGGSPLQQQNNTFFAGIKQELDSLNIWMINGKLNIALVGELSDIDKTGLSVATKTISFIEQHPASELSGFLLFNFGYYEKIFFKEFELHYLKSILGNNAKNFYEQMVLRYESY